MLALLQGIFTKAKGAFGAVTTAFQGRSTTFAVFFALTAFILACLGKLTDQYVHAMWALQAYVLGHSIKESYFKEGADADNCRAPDTNF